MNDTTETPDPAKRVRTLNNRQHIALRVLADNGTHQEAADAAGVQRTTVTDWANHHPGFQAALNAFHQAVNRELLAKQLRGATAVLDHLLKGVESGDSRSVELWLRHVGVTPLAAQAIGSTDPDELIDQRVAPLVEAAAVDRAAANVAAIAPHFTSGTTRPEVRRSYETKLAERLDRLEESDAVQRGIDERRSRKS